jgi:hypothetical protein
MMAQADCGPPGEIDERPRRAFGHVRGKMHGLDGSAVR